MNYRNYLKILCIISVICLCCTCMGCSKTKSTGSTSITLNEVAHSVFYAPQYAAIELGYFKEEGIDLTLVTGFGADNVMTSLISDDAQIGLMGSESSIYVYAQGASDYAVNFAQLTQRAGNFLVSRTAEDDFSWENLRGKTILGGRAGGMPQMLLEYILEKNGLTKEDVNIIQNVDFGSTAAAFRLALPIIPWNLNRPQHFWNRKAPDLSWLLWAWKAAMCRILPIVPKRASFLKTPM